MEMSDEHRSTKEVEVDFDRLARLGNKLNELLVRKTKGTAEAYAVLRFLCVWYEEDLGIAFSPEFEEELRNVIKKRLERDESEPSTSL